MTATRSPAAIGIQGSGSLTFAITGDTVFTVPATTSGFITANGVQTLTNKTIDANLNTISNISINLSSVSGLLGPAQGGTGVANGAGSTITLGGALTFSGAFGTTITVTGTTAVTLPTSGTLLSTAALVTGAQGGTGNGFFAVTGPSGSLKTFTFPNSSATVLTSTGATTTLGGNIVTANTFTTAGNFPLTLTTTASTNVRLPVTGTLATLDGVEALTNKTITFVGVTETVVPVTIVSNALTVNLALGTIFTCSLNANINTFTISGAAAGKSFTLILTGDGSVRTIPGITSNANISFGDAGTPTLSSTSGKDNWLGFSTKNGTNFAATARTGF